MAGRVERKERTGQRATRSGSTSSSVSSSVTSNKSSGTSSNSYTNLANQYQSQANSINLNNNRNNYTPDMTQANNYGNLANQYGSLANSVNLNLNRNNYTPDLSAYNNYINQANNYINQASQIDYTMGENKYQQIYEDAYNALANREAFSYNQKDDPLYQQYEEMYTRNARLGMQDTMAQAAALTGGYGSSYSETAGQSMYNQTMNGLNEKALQLYDAALNTYNSESNRLYQNFGAASDMYGTEQNNLQFISNQAQQQQQFLHNLGYNYTNLGEDARQFAENMAESQYQYDKGYNLDLYNTYSSLGLNYNQLSNSASEFAKTMAENQYQYDSNMDYQKWAELNSLAYNYNSLGENARQFDEELNYQKLSDNEKMAYNYLVNGYNSSIDPTTGRVVADGTRTQAYLDEYNQGRQDNYFLNGYNLDGTRTKTAQQEWQLKYDQAQADLNYTQAMTNKANAERYENTGRTENVNKIEKFINSNIPTESQFENAVKQGSYNPNKKDENGKYQQTAGSYTTTFNGKKYTYKSGDYDKFLKDYVNELAREYNLTTDEKNMLYYDYYLN